MSLTSTEPKLSWRAVFAVFRKEWRSEFRSLSGLTSTLLLGLVGVVIINNVTSYFQLKPLFAAGLLWILLCFAGSVSLPRSFLIDAEQRTMDFWMLHSTPETVYWGKALFNSVQMLVNAVILSLMFLLFLHIRVESPGLFALSIASGAIAIAITATLAGAIASASSNGYAVATVVSLPLLTFLVNLGMAGVATALGEALRQGERAAAGILLYAIALAATGHLIVRYLWRTGPPQLPNRPNRTD